MGLQPKINGKTVEREYEEYRNGVYLVNRRYQRKLDLPKRLPMEKKD